MNHVSDFIVRIKNAYLARRPSVEMPYSNVVLAIGKVLVKEGFLAEVKETTVDNHRRIAATLRYVRRKPVLHGINVISKPSLRSYIGTKEAQKVDRGVVTTLISTSAGVMTGKEAAKKGVGGEVLFAIW